MMTDPTPGQYGDPRGYPPPLPGNLQRGELIPRFLARLIDYVIVVIIGVVLALLLDALTNIWVTSLFAGVLTFIYFVAFETTQGTTPGKKVLGMRVLGPTAAPKPTAAQSAVRNAFTVLWAVPYFGGLLAVIAIIVIAATINGSPTKQGKHDVMAGGTQVVKG
jgi:uncharacterized RDD family membrane protein YckC